MQKVIAAAVIASVVLVTCITGFWKEDTRLKRKNSISLIHTSARAVQFYYSNEGKLPRSLDFITATPPVLDLFGQPLKYETYSHFSNRFSIQSLGVKSETNHFVFEIDGTNLLIVAEGKVE